MPPLNFLRLNTLSVLNIQRHTRQILPHMLSDICTTDRFKLHNGVNVECNISKSMWKVDVQNAAGCRVCAT